MPNYQLFLEIGILLTLTILMTIVFKYDQDQRIKYKQHFDEMIIYKQLEDEAAPDFNKDKMSKNYNYIDRPIEFNTVEWLLSIIMLSIPLIGFVEFCRLLLG